MNITPIYAGLATFIFIFLSFRVIAGRNSAGVALGDGGNRALLRRQRAHGNFSEYVPLVLLLMALAELQGAPTWTLQLMGIALLAGRLVHAYAVTREPEPIKLRVLGMTLTFVALVTGAVTNLGIGGLATPLPS
jgi:uncharacterized membrane protein YecN with MAPEG domain